MSIDKASYDTDTSSTGSGSESNEDATNLRKMMMDTKVDGGKSAWATTLETFGMSDGGKRKKDDILCDTFADAMKVFYELIPADLEFPYTPFDDFEATKEQLLQAFVHWSRKTGDDGDEATYYNPSKALRRLLAYVEWMDKNCKELNLKGTTMGAIADSWKLMITRDKHGRLVWWIDVAALDLKYIKTSVPPEDTLRYFVWLTHLVLFDKGAQEKGFVMAEAMGFQTGMLEAMTMVSMDVGTKLDRLTIGTLPIKMEALYFFRNPTWLRIMMGLMAPFMGKKMRNRVVLLSNNEDPQLFLNDKLGKESIPVGMSGLEATVKQDMIAQTFERLANVITDEIET